MTDGRNALTWGMFEPDPRNVLNASEPTQADAYSYNAPVVRDAWAAAQDPQTWQDAAQQYGQGLLAGSVAPGAKGMALDPAALQVLREMTPGFRAYHGSPHSFDRFSSDKIGTGEGAQAYGHGLYFADAEATARSYRDALSANPDHGFADMDTILRRMSGYGAVAAGDVREALTGSQHLSALADNPDVIRSMQALLPGYDPKAAVTGDALRHYRVLNDAIEANVKPGHMYEVRVNADPAHFLDWDKPLSEQSPVVQAKIANLSARGIGARNPAPDMTGGQWYVDTHAGGHKSADISALLHSPMPGEAEPAIPGIRYLDGISRANGVGSSNHVIFDPATIEILRKYGIAGLMAGGGAAAAGKEQQ